MTDRFNLNHAPEPKEQNKTMMKVEKRTTTKKMTASPTENSSDTTGTGRKRRQNNSMEGSHMKQQKTCPLTATDIPDIVSAVVKALPSQTVTTSPDTRLSHQTSCQTTGNNDQTCQVTVDQTSCCRGIPASRELQDTTDKEMKILVSHKA